MTEELKMPAEAWLQERSPNNLGRHGVWTEADMVYGTHYTRTDLAPAVDDAKRAFARDTLDAAYNPMTTKTGEAYRTLRDELLADWLERNIDVVRQALAAPDHTDGDEVEARMIYFQGVIEHLEKKVADHTELLREALSILEFNKAWGGGTKYLDGLISRINAVLGETK